MLKRYWGIGITIFLLIAGFTIAGSSNEEKLKLVTPPDDLLSQVVDQHYAGRNQKQLDTENLKVLEFMAEGETLYIFDFGTQDLCGIRGCLYAIHKADGSILARNLVHFEKILALVPIGK